MINGQLDEIDSNMLIAYINEEIFMLPQIRMRLGNIPKSHFIFYMLTILIIADTDAGIARSSVGTVSQVKTTL